MGGGSSGVGVELHVLDGNWIAEHLAKSDAYWIAQQFLSLPADLPGDTPVESSETPWYEELRSRWREIETPAGAFGEFQGLKNALRHVSVSEERRDDVAFWIGRAETFIHVAPRALDRRAFYEIAVASLKAQGSMRGLETRLEQYFDSALEEMDPISLEDAQVLLLFVAGARDRDKVAVSSEQINQWALGLQKHVAALADAEHHPGSKCHLLQTLGSLILVPNPDEEGGGVDRKVEEAIDVWARLLDAVAGAPLFPVDRFASIFSVVSPLFSEHRDYRALTRRIDSLVGERAGRSAAAELCRDRAMALFKQDKLIAAIEEFHEARVDWFTGDTLRGSLLATSLIAHCYGRLGLEYASKYNWLALARGAIAANDPSLLDFPAKGVLYAAQDDYRSGASFGFLGLVRAGLLLHVQLEENAWDVEEHETLQASYLALTVLHQYVRSAGSAELQEWFEGLADQLDLREMLDALVGDAEAALGTDAEDLARTFATQLGVVPFADAGQKRIVRWRALGITWEVEFANDYETTLIAERFMALTQILLADLAGVELALLPTKVSIQIASGNKMHVRESGPNEARRWHLTLVPADGRDSAEVQSSTIAPIASILSRVSVLPDADLSAVLDDAYERGLPSKMLPLGMYDEVLTEFLPEEAFAADVRHATAAPVVESVRPREPSTELEWNDTPGPGYSPEQAAEFIHNRYEALTERLRLTLPRLLAEPRTRELLMSLRQEGWLDWQILSAIFGIAHNWRAYNRPSPPRTHEERFTALLSHEGPESSEFAPVPLDEFTREKLTRAVTLNLPATLRTWALELRQPVPDFRAMGRFLDVRYKHSSDDVEHADIFAEAGDGVDADTHPSG